MSRARRSARRLRWTLTLAWAAATFASPAHAHHGTSTTRVGDGGAPRVGARLSSLPPAPRLELGLSLDTQYFDRARAGSEAYTKLPLGSVWVNRLSLSAQLELASLTSVGVRVPTGVVSVKPPEAPSHSSTGLGDVELFVAQELLTPLRSLGGAGARPKTPVRLILRAGVVAPTGVYEPDSQLTLTDVSGGPGGSIGVNTYNTRTSLGGGSWAASGALTLHWQLSSRTAMQLETALSLPLSRTSDDILWGVDESMRGLASFELLPERLGVLGGVDYRRHASDEIQRDISTAGGAPLTRPERVGGRRELAALAGLQLAPARSLSCGVLLHLPLWQHASGVQLVETLSASANCAWTVGL